MRVDPRQTGKCVPALNMAGCYDFNAMAVGDWMEVSELAAADRIISAGNSHACNARVQGRKYSRKKIGWRTWAVIRIA